MSVVLGQLHRNCDMQIRKPNEVMSLATVDTEARNVRTIQCGIPEVLFQSNKVQDKEGEPHRVLQIRGIVCINTRT
jgi:hypothetical protein